MVKADGRHQQKDFIDMKLQVKRLSEDVKLPTKAYEGDAGWDLYSCEDVHVTMHFQSKSDLLEVHTGVAVAIPEGYYGQIMCRSGLGRKGWRVHPGVIDAGYRGEITIFIQNHRMTQHNMHEGQKLDIKKGDKIAQMLILPVPHFELEVVEDLPESQRGEKGFGSSGR